MAIVPPLGRSSTSTVADNHGNMTVSFFASPSAMNKLTDDLSGYVYVMEKSGFTQHNNNPSEYKVTGPIKPYKKIRVSVGDLPAIEMKIYTAPPNRTAESN